mgnify:CR=1 FL=1
MINLNNLKKQIKIMTTKENSFELDGDLLKDIEAMVEEDDINENETNISSNNLNLNLNDSNIVEEIEKEIENRLTKKKKHVNLYNFTFLELSLF